MLLSRPLSGRWRTLVPANRLDPVSLLLPRGRSAGHRANRVGGNRNSTLEHGQAGLVGDREGGASAVDDGRNVDRHRADQRSPTSGCAVIPSPGYVRSIAGATSSSYTLTSADIGFKIQSSVTATNVAGQATARSYASAVVTAAAPANTAKPALSGTAKEGQALVDDGRHMDRHRADHVLLPVAAL